MCYSTSSYSFVQLKYAHLNCTGILLIRIFNAIMIDNRNLKNLAAVFVLLIFAIHVSGDIILCPALSHPPNGEVLHSNRRPNSVAVYKCDRYYKLVGDSERECQADGTWSGSSPTCEIILCPALSHPSNGEVLHSNRRPNSVAVYKCDRYYKLVGVTKRECQPDGTWSGSSPTCEKITCMAPGNFPNGRIIGKNSNVYNVSDIIIFRCHDGITYKTSKCLENGEWSARPPTCPAILCPALSHPPNGEVLLSNRRPNSVAVYKCDRYYKIVGDSERECQADGTWSGSSPTCEKITCMAPGNFPNGRIIGRNSTVYNVADILIFNCYDGTHVVSKCLENGEWSVRPPTCTGTSVVEPTVVTTTFASEDSNADEIESKEGLV